MQSNHSSGSSQCPLSGTGWPSINFYLLPSHSPPHGDDFPMSVSTPSFPGFLGGPQPSDQKPNWSSFLKPSKSAEISLLSPRAPFSDFPVILPLELLSGNFTSCGFLAGILTESAKFFLPKNRVPLLPPQIQLSIVVETSEIRWKCTRYGAL